jgi:hypothetical protein
VRDYYRVLQVQRHAHPEVVRAAFRTLLKVLGKHPDLGGEPGDARALIEAYQTLSDPERRRAYDLWLQAHSRRAPAPDRRALAPGIANWIRIVLPEFRDAPEAPFGGRFDLTLAAPGSFGGYLYVKAFAAFRRPGWQWTLTVSRAVRLVRAGLVPTTDALLVVTPRARDLERFFAEAAERDGRWAWTRCVLAVMSLFPPTLELGAARWPPAALCRLQKHLATLDLSRLAGPLRDPEAGWAREEGAP